MREEACVVRLARPPPERFLFEAYKRQPGLSDLLRPYRPSSFSKEYFTLRRSAKLLKGERLSSDPIIAATRTTSCGGYMSQ